MHKGLLGMNARNFDYVYKYNDPKSIKLADDKYWTKKILTEHDISTPTLYDVIESRRDLKAFDPNKLPNDFVIKPNAGLGGEGIMVIVGKSGDKWTLANGNEVDKTDIIRHITEILDGNFSISGASDIALIEKRLIIHEVFENISYKGIPDIRIIVYRNIPVMAMIRLPTKKSEGKANLHLGGVGAGINIATGKTTYAVMNGKAIDKNPDTGVSITGIQMPNWDKALEIAIRSQQISGLGYLGADIVIDKDLGPMILELNARPGLAIQISNMELLKERLDLADKYNVDDYIEGIKIAKKLFK